MKAREAILLPITFILSVLALADAHYMGAPTWMGESLSVVPGGDAAPWQVQVTLLSVGFAGPAIAAQFFAEAPFVAAGEVQVMTTHRAQGLEFRCVAIPGRARTGESAFEVFGVDASAVRSEVECALRDGSFTLVLAVDTINHDLRRIVAYLNAITRDDVSIMAFEATRVAHGQVEILMPRV